MLCIKKTHLSPALRLKYRKYPNKILNIPLAIIKEKVLQITTALQQELLENYEISKQQRYNHSYPYW